MAQQFRVRGQNFDGSIKLEQDFLSMQVIQFGTGNVYNFSITEQQLQRQFKRFLVIKRVCQLYDQFKINQKSYITEADDLIIPIQVLYRGRIEDLNVELKLKKEEFETEKQLNKKYIMEIERMSKENLIIEKYREKYIRFQGDQKNTNIKNFDISARKNVIQYKGNNIHTLLNHFEPIPRIGIYYFKSKINKTYGKNIIFGVCSHDIKSSTNSYHSPYFLGLYLSEKTILGNSKSDVAIQPVEIIEGKSIVKIEIDMNKSVVSWFLDETFLCARRIPNEIQNKDIYPLISFYNIGDTIEIPQN